MMETAMSTHEESMTLEQRKQAAKTVFEWIEEYRGKDAADYWAWERTPMPCGLPSDEQLEEGLNLALRTP